ncbi:MAG: peptidoglycan DD-metalloendopeptidase family protein [Clostridia bacterium]|nr:peptidoglycan DD-metalloendopeptidase family protein [Clostridia bacterium]
MDKIISLIVSILTAFLNVIQTLLGLGGSISIKPPETDKKPTQWPVSAVTVIAKGYGYQADGTYHNGIDIVLKEGETEGQLFCAIGDGKVIEVKNGDTSGTGYGNYVIVEHSDEKYISLYSQAQEITVKQGELVDKGQTLGKIGKSGDATTAHLHLGAYSTDNKGHYTEISPLTIVDNPYPQPTEPKPTDPTPSNPTNPTDPTPSVTIPVTYEYPYKVPTTQVKVPDGGFKGTFTFTTYGWGHGVGMSQEGAIAMAKDGKSFKEILLHYYPGTEISVDSSTPATVTKNGNNVPILEYLCKTVMQEIGDGAPMEALKAQAVAAYTYGKKYGYGSGQAYNSSFKYSGTNVEKACMAVLGMTAATDTPKAMYVTYKGETAETFYFDSAAGKTTSCKAAWGGDEPDYLKGGVTSPEDINKVKYTKTISAQDMYNLIMKYDSKACLSENPAEWIFILSQDASVDANTGYVYEVQLGSVKLSGLNFREQLMGNGNLRSHCFTVTYDPNGTVA